MTSKAKWMFRASGLIAPGFALMCVKPGSQLSVFMIYFDASIIYHIYYILWCFNIEKCESWNYSNIGIHIYNNCY